MFLSPTGLQWLACVFGLTAPHILYACIHTDNKIGDERAKALAAAVKVNTTVTSIVLGGESE